MYKRQGLGISGYGEGEGTETGPLEACEEVLSPGRAICRCDTYVGWAGSLRCTPGINAVSYTHLDVYKRQDQQSKIAGHGHRLHAALDLDRFKTGLHRFVGDPQHTAGSVSYTHLFKNPCAKHDNDGIFRRFRPVQHRILPFHCITAYILPQ